MEMEGEHEAGGAVGGDRRMRDGILDAALSFICSTDKDLEICDRDGDGTRQVNSATWRQLRSRLKDGTASVSCVIDFAYSDGGRLKGNDRQLERAYCLHDPQQGHPDELLSVIHVHTTEKWVDRKKLSTGRPLSRITSVNIRHAHKREDVGFQQEDGRQAWKLVPKNKDLIHQWKDLAEEEIVWYPGGKDGVPAVPRKDKDYKSLYEEVGDFIKAGERFCEEVRRLVSVCMYVLAYLGVCARWCVYVCMYWYNI